MNNNSRKLTDSERLMAEKKLINSLIEEDVYHATLIIKRAHLSLLQETFPESSIVPAFPCLEVGNPSLEEYFADEDTSDDERTFLHHGPKILADFSKALYDEDDEIVVSFYPHKN